ncbi:hypothetical protein MTR_2g025290 [Medicago truncatula]|uniref:Uncharacterized protein n=1 Tax=Medicago truncatula TaxID=3880 RepID=G7ILS3_MEDTR|nr:hypothetical protein MTR_2g025290 [Medicago truncatula]
MQDTLHNHIGINGYIDDVEAIENGSNKVDKENTVQKNEILFRNWPLMSSIMAEYYSEALSISSRTCQEHLRMIMAMKECSKQILQTGKKVENSDSNHGLIISMFMEPSTELHYATILKIIFVHEQQRVYVLAQRDISISQNKGSTSGIPQYIMQIVNTCVFGCAPNDIHLHCGWFASARINNPRLFKRLSYGWFGEWREAFTSSQIIRFTYSNSLMKPLAFKSARFS